MEAGVAAVNIAGQTAGRALGAYSCLDISVVGDWAGVLAVSGVFLSEVRFRAHPKARTIHQMRIVHNRIRWTGNNTAEFMVEVVFDAGCALEVGGAGHAFGLAGLACMGCQVAVEAILACIHTVLGLGLCEVGVQALQHTFAGWEVVVVDIGGGGAGGLTGPRDLVGIEILRAHFDTGALIIVAIVSRRNGTGSDTAPGRIISKEILTAASLTIPRGIISKVALRAERHTEIVKVVHPLKLRVLEDAFIQTETGVIVAVGAFRTLLLAGVCLVYLV